MDEEKLKGRLSSDQYKTFAKWFKEIGLGALGALVAQHIVSGGVLSDPVVVVGVLIAVFMYGMAFRLQLKA